MSAADLRQLRGPLLLLAMLLGIAIAAFHFAWQRVEAAQQQLRQETARARDAQTRLLLSGREREIIVQHLAAYRQLERAGFVAPEQRINWVTGLRNANAAAGLFGIDYQIAAQRPYRGAQRLDARHLDLLESPMRLKAELLHEGDLPRLMSALEEQELGLYLLDECTLKRLPAGNVLRYQPHVDAECQLAWITARVRASQGQR